MPIYTKPELEEMRAKDLKRMAFHDMGLTGLSKKPKDVVVKAIMKAQGPASSPAAVAPTPKTETGPVTKMEFKATSLLSKPSARFGNRNTTTIQVSCGANNGEFAVVGRTVGNVAEFLREILNVDRMSTGLVNGKEVGNDYVLKEKDTLEFLKPVGKKGC